MIYSKGICWLDECRIPFVDEGEMEGVCKSDKTKKEYIKGWGGIFNYKRSGGNTKGRFTPNLLVSDDVLNDGSVSNSSGGKGEKTLGTLGRNGIYNKGWGKDETADGLGGYGDKGSNSRYYDIDLWFNKLIYGLQ